MKKLISILVFALLITQTTIAETGLSIKAGINYPHFKNNAIGLVPDYLISVEKDWHFIKGTLFTCGVKFFTIKGTLKNVTVGSETGFSSHVSYENINIIAGFMEFPLYLFTIATLIITPLAFTRLMEPYNRIFLTMTQVIIRLAVLASLMPPAASM